MGNTIRIKDIKGVRVALGSCNIKLKELVRIDNALNKNVFYLKNTKDIYTTVLLPEYNCINKPFIVLSRTSQTSTINLMNTASRDIYYIDDNLITIQFNDSMTSQIVFHYLNTNNVIELLKDSRHITKKTIENIRIPKKLFDEYFTSAKNIIDRFNTCNGELEKLFCFKEVI